MSQPILVGQGTTGQLEVYEDRVVLRRTGLTARLAIGAVGDKTIPIDRLGAVQFRKPGTFTGGYIQFAYSGSKEVKGGGIMDAARDENTMFFKPEHLETFERARDLIEERMHRPAKGGGSALSVAEQLEKLVALRDKGILSDDEFAAQKAKVLGL